MPPIVPAPPLGKSVTVHLPQSQFLPSNGTGPNSLTVMPQLDGSSPTAMTFSKDRPSIVQYGETKSITGFGTSNPRSLTPQRPLAFTGGETAKTFDSSWTFRLGRRSNCLMAVLGFIICRLHCIAAISFQVQHPIKPSRRQMISFRYNRSSR